MNEPRNRRASSRESNVEPQRSPASAARYDDLSNEVAIAKQELASREEDELQQMDELDAQLKALTIQELRHELRKRSVNDHGRKKKRLRDRLRGALKREYNNGWTRGYLLNIKIIPFDGRGRDPQTLVGRHVTGLRAKGSNRLIIMLSDGQDQTVVFQASYSQSGDTDELHLALSAGLIRLVRTSSDEPPTDQKSFLITEAATALCKNHHGEEAARTIGIKLAGMKTMAFFNMSNDKNPDHTSWAKLRVDVYFAGDEDVVNQSTYPLFPENDKPIKIKEWYDGVCYGSNYLC